MSVIVKGMEMPKRCLDCPFMISRDNDDCVLQTEVENELARTWEELKASCPLVEIPTPHGRLIDADEFIRELASEHVGGLDAIKKYTDADTWTSGLHTAWRLIDDASTVIEAEGSET